MIFSFFLINFSGFIDSKVMKGQLLDSSMKRINFKFLIDDIFFFRTSRPPPGSRKVYLLETDEEKHLARPF